MFGFKTKQPKKNHTTGRNQEMFKTEEVPWNMSISINISSKAHKRKTQREKISEVFLPDTLKITSQMKN